MVALQSYFHPDTLAVQTLQVSAAAMLFRNMHASEVKRSFDFMCSVTVFAQLGGGVQV